MGESHPLTLPNLRSLSGWTSPIAFMITLPTFVRRLGKAQASFSCVSLDACPEILELSDGTFAIIGKDITAESHTRLPAGVGCGPDERVVVIPRSLLIQSKRDIPNA